MRKRIAMAAVGVMCLAAPAVTQGAVATSDAGNGGRDSESHDGYEQRYLELRKKYVKEFGLRSAGRDIVRDGYLEKDGDIREATRQEVVTSTDRMQVALNPPEVATGYTETAAYTSTAAPTSVIQCESGGDYTAVNPAGYYGAYQFDQQTWDAYAPEGYAGVNPASAPPSVQDAAAASVPYDAWPNC